MSLLQVAGISKQFGGLAALTNVSLQVQPGERRAIIGPNGAGKTTLFNVITGELSPNGGMVHFEIGTSPRYRFTHAPTSGWDILSSATIFSSVSLSLKTCA